MSLAAGARLGPYEIVSPLGAGGMGEVYRAKDGRLNRTVAIKILSDESAADADRRERFEREAKAISALDHPNICPLYDVGEHEGTYFLVMPCLEGQTLADRIAKGPLPPDQAIKHAIEIATALDAAHRHGIIHRDLKPGNIMLTKTGVKLLDFGLAKLKKAAGPLGDTTMVKGTGIGTLLGTMPYMAPEQIEGREVDARSDIFSLGAVIYEMVTGQRAFKGDSPASVIGAILKDDPPAMKAMQPLTPSALDHVVSVCLAKEPDERWQSSADIARELQWIKQGASGAVPDIEAKPRRSRWMVPAVTAVATALSVALIGWAAVAPRESDVVVRFTISPQRGTLLAPQRSSLGILQFAISPDGRKLAFVGAPPGGEPALWMRGLNETTARELHGTLGAADPFWSPDSQSVGFFAGSRLKIIDLGSSELRDVCAASRSPRGGAWTTDGVIIFGGDSGAGFSKVSIATGKVDTATATTAAGSHRWPWLLPDGRRFLYYARGDPEHRGIYVGSLDGTAPVRVIDSMFNGVYANGHLLTLRRGTLIAYPFDERTARVTGDPIQLVDGIAGSSTQRGAFSVAANGILVHAGGTHQSSTLAWFDRAGRVTPTPIAASTIVTFHLSPDDRRVAMARVDETTNTSDIWIADLDRAAASTRLTIDPANDLSAIWSADGRRIVFRSDRTGDNFLFGKASTGTAADEMLTNFNSSNPTDWSADGKSIVFHQSLAATNSDIGITPPALNIPPTFLIQTPFDEYDGRFSPDNRWLAYVSDESGRPEVYVQTYPLTGNKWTISTNGGAEPRWRADGRELFYLAGDGKLMAVAVSGGTMFEAAAPAALFQTAIRPVNNPFHVSMDASADGQRFLIKVPTESIESSSGLTVVLNWPALTRGSR